MRCPFMDPELDLGAWVSEEQRGRQAVLPALPLLSWRVGHPGCHYLLGSD